MPLRNIKQTSRTLLIEQFSNESMDLRTLLKNEYSEDKDDFQSKIEQNLEVRSFEEFAKKFTPTVYQWVTSTADNQPVFNFSLEKPDDVPVEFLNMTPLDKNEFYKMVMSVYSAKGASGKSNYEFDYTKVAELLSPQKVVEDFKLLRKDLLYNTIKLQELDESRKTEAGKYKKRIQKIRQDYADQYKDNFLANLKLKIADTERQLLSFGSSKSDGGEDSKGDIPKLCYISFDDKGAIEVKQIESGGCNKKTLQLEYKPEERAKTQAIEWIEKDFDASGNRSKYVKELVKSTILPPAGEVELSRNELETTLTLCRELYVDAQTHFVRAISSAVERMLNVKAFFEQATTARGKLRAPLIVANCKADQLLAEDVKENFRKFISELSEETGAYKIWFSILPAVGNLEFVDTLEEDIDLDAPVYAQGYSEPDTLETKDGEKLTSENCLKQIVDILKDAKITTFFNYRANEMTGFGKLNSDLVDRYRKHLEPLDNNPYAVFCYPNFTVLPKKETCIPIGSKELGVSYLDIAGIYIDASYVAAGLVVGSQDPDYLKSKGYKIVNDNNPCVRFDIEEERFNILTTMNREGKLNWDSEAEKNIGKDKFGFCFCGKSVSPQGKKIDHSYVYVARNMSVDNKGVYKPIYTTLTMDFIIQYLRTKNINVGGGNNFKMSDVEKYIKDYVSAWQNESDAVLSPINSILRKGESVNLDLETKTVKVKFNQTEIEEPISIEMDEISQQTNE